MAALTVVAVNRKTMTNVHELRPGIIKTGNLLWLFNQYSLISCCFYGKSTEKFAYLEVIGEVDLNEIVEAETEQWPVLFGAVVGA